MRLEAEGLAIGYGRTEIGTGIDVTVNTGDFLCLLGPNGCGKTTLFRTLLGQIPSLGGQLALDGVPLGQFSTLAAQTIPAFPAGSASWC